MNRTFLWAILSACGFALGAARGTASIDPTPKDSVTWLAPTSASTSVAASSPIVPGDLPAAQKPVSPRAMLAEQRKAEYEEACEEKLALYKLHLKNLEERVEDLGPEGAADLVRAVSQMEGKVKSIEGQLRAVEQADGKSWDNLKRFLDETFYDLDASLADAQGTILAH